MIKTLLFGLLMIPLNVLWAQQIGMRVRSDSVLTVSAEKIEVMSSLRNLKINVDSLSLQSSSGRMLADILSASPGVWVADRNNMSQGERMVIRGQGWRSSFGIRGIHLRFNEIPLTFPDGQSISTLVEPKWLTGISVVPGPTGAGYGNASGGVVLFNSNPGRGVSTEMQAGSFGERKLLSQWSISNKESQLLGGISYWSADGFRDHSSFEIFRGHFQYRRFITDKLRFNVSGIGEIAPNLQNPSGLTQEQLSDDPSQANSFFKNNNARKSTRQIISSLSLEHFGSRWNSRIHTWFGFRDLENPLPFAFIELDRKHLGTEVVVSRRFTNLDLSFGADLQYQSDRRLESESVQGEKGSTVFADRTEEVNALGAWLSLEYRWEEYLSFFASMRSDIQSMNLKGSSGLKDDFDALNYSAGVRKDFDQTSIVMHYSSSFDTPTLNELSNNLDRGIDLGSETSRQLELNLSRNGQFLTSFAVYYLWSQNRITPFEFADSPGETGFRNLGSGHGFGTQWTLWGKFSQAWNFNVSFGYLSLKATDQDRTFKVPGIPEFNGQLLLSYSVNAFRFTSQSRIAGAMRVSTIQDVSTDSWYLQDLNVSWRIPLNPVEARTFVRVINVFDNLIVQSVVIDAAGDRFFEPSAGRSLLTGLRFKF